MKIESGQPGGVPSLLQQPAKRPLRIIDLVDAESVQKSKDLQATFDSMKIDMKAERKAAAAQKVERLKRELLSLRMMGGLGDPKAMARQAARIAQELGAAAKEYAAAGGSAAQPVQATAGEGEGQPPPSGDQAVAAALRNEYAQRQQESDQAKADNEFVTELRGALALLKALMAQQRQRAEQAKKVDEEFGVLERAVAAARSTVDQAVATIMAPPLPATPLTVLA